MMTSRRRVVASIAFVLVVALTIVLWRVNGTDIPESDNDLLEVIRSGDVEGIEAYLGAGGAPNRRIDVYGREMSLLQAAVVDREESIAVSLIRAGVDLSASGVGSQDAGRNGLDKVLELFLELAPPSGPDVRYSGVVDAALNGYYDSVRLYIDHSAQSGSDWTLELNRAAGAAMMAGYDDVALLIFEAGAPLDEMLHAVSRFSSPGMVRYLLSRGIDPNEELGLPPTAEPPERTPIEFAWKRYQEASTLVGAVGPEASLARLAEMREAEFVLYELSRAGADPARLNVDVSGHGAA